MLGLFPFDLWLIIVGLIFRRIKINTLPAALVTPSAFLFYFEEVMSSLQRGEETKYRKSDGPHNESPRYREEAEAYDSNKEKDDYFEIQCTRGYRL